MTKWNKVVEELPETHKHVWCCFRGGKVFLGAKMTNGNSENKGWFNFESQEDCWVNWWCDLDKPNFDLEWKDR